MRVRVTPGLHYPFKLHLTLLIVYLRMKSPLVVFLLLTQLIWSQQAAEPDLILGQDTLDLGQQTIVLREVVVGSNSLSAEELLLAAKKKMARAATDTLIRPYSYFIRASELNDIRAGFDLRKTTLDGIDDDFIANLAESIPKHTASHTEALYSLSPQDSSPKPSVRLLRGFILEDESNQIDTKDLEQYFVKEIERVLEAGNYFKVKSGIFGAKIKQEDIDLDELRGIKDTILPDSLQTKALKNEHRWASGLGYQHLEQMAEYHPYGTNALIEVFSKPKRFDFQITDYTLVKDQWVYVVAFKEKSKAEFYGELYINESDKGLVQFKFVNGGPIQSIRLLGFSYREARAQGHYFYRRGEDDNYHFYFGRLEQDTEVGINRPLSLIEKRKALIGGRKVNRIDLDILFELHQTEEHTFILGGQDRPPIQTDSTALPTLEKLSRYPEGFWKDTEFTIAPSEAMRSFQLSKAGRQGEH